MSKENKNSDPLEQFFREKSKDYDIEYREEDWQKLEARLDEADRLHWQRRKRWVAAAVVAILFSVLAYITYDQQLKINQLTDKLNSQEQLTNVAPTSEAPSNKPAIPPDKENAENRNNETAEENDPTQENPASTITNEPSPQNESTFDNKSQENEPENRNTLALSGLAFKEKALVIAKASTGFDGRSPAISAIKPADSPPSGNLFAYNSSQSTDQEPKLLAPRQFPRFSLGFVVGPDLSTAGSMSDFYDPGYKIGVSAEYNITQNLAISVGLQRTKVQYLASGNDYSPPQGYWSYGVRPNETLGECILIDIPVSLKYNVMHFQHSRLYATAGLSSYVMLDEDYRFTYKNNQPGLKQRWHERTGTTHWMSNATLSVGYELDFTQTLSLRAEPFLKLPLKEVGWGNVNLYSVGSLVSINYKIN